MTTRQAAGGTGRERAEPADAAKAGRGTRLALVLLLAIGSVHILFMIGVEAIRFFQAGAAITRLEGEVAALEQEAAGLRAVVEHGGDERYREQLARRQGFMYPNETRIVTLGLP